MTRFALASLIVLSAACAADDDWPGWRGPYNNGMARGDAPLSWSDQKNIAWKAPIPGRGHSSPVLWGDRIFLTTAVPQSEISEGADRRGPGGGTGIGIEHKFMVMSLDRRTGKVIWERVATVAKPHEGYHFKYGSFASNSPVTDGKHLIAFFGSRGVFCYDLDGKLLWQKDFVPMRMRLGFGEGTAPMLHGDRVFLNFDQEGDSFLVALNKADGKELWRVTRYEPSSWSAPLVVVSQRPAAIALAQQLYERTFFEHVQFPSTGRSVYRHPPQQPRAHGGAERQRRD